MSGIRGEVIVFLLAFISGAIVRLTYRGIHCIRNMIRHSLFAMELEDILFWTGAALYLFVQIYHTSDGSIRWYFILGVVFGAVISSFILWKIEKLHKKIYGRKQKKFGKNVAQFKKNRYDIG